ncbi:MAG: hypothetical protein ABJB74_14655, partial [Gemmatimonas sp.]
AGAVAPAFVRGSVPEFMRACRRGLVRNIGMLAACASILLSSQFAIAQTVPVVELTGEVVIDGERLELRRLFGGRVGPTGSIYVVGNRERELLVFNGDGQKRGVLGRDGSGPGDFRSMRQLGFVGDTLWIGDPILQRVTLYTAHDKLIGTRRIEKLTFPPGFLNKFPKLNGIFPRAIFGDRSMLVMAVAWSLYLDTPTAITPRIPLLKVSGKGGRRFRTIASPGNGATVHQPPHR